jgi:hypothetical protein
MAAIAPERGMIAGEETKLKLLIDGSNEVRTLQQ